MLNKREIRTVIEDFYRNEYQCFIRLGVDELLVRPLTAELGCLHILLRLKEHLKHKALVKGLLPAEIELMDGLPDGTPDDGFIQAFKDVLQSMQTI